jgi:hypothetical protein
LSAEPPSLEALPILIARLRGEDSHGEAVARELVDGDIVVYTVGVTAPDSVIERAVIMRPRAGSEDSE